MQVLFLSTWLPYPQDNASKLRTYSQLQILAERHAVTLISFAPPAAEEVPAPLRSVCRDVDIVPTVPFHPRSVPALAGALRAAPRSLTATFSPVMAARIEATLADRDFDVVVAAELQTARYAPLFSTMPAIFENAEIGVLWEQCKRAPTAFGRVRYGLTWVKHRRYMARLLRHFRACTVASEVERRLLMAAVPAAPRIEVIPNAVDCAAAAQVVVERDAARIIFAGSFSYEPNYDAMQWFATAVFPHIARAWPPARVIVTGDPAGRVLPPTPGIVATGLVDDVRQAVASAAVSVAPIRIGGGTRGKILEAMALGTPVVATSKGAEGLDVVSGEHLLIADDPQAFAGHVVRLLGDPALRERLAARARELVTRRYDWTVVATCFTALIEEVARASR